MLFRRSTAPQAAALNPIQITLPSPAMIGSTQPIPHDSREDRQEKPESPRDHRSLKNSAPVGYAMR
jgi:hypothetical protein